MGEKLELTSGRPSRRKERKGFDMSDAPPLVRMSIELPENLREDFLVYAKRKKTTVRALILAYMERALRKTELLDDADDE